MKKLSDILEKLKVQEIKGNTEVIIHQLSQDTRESFPEKTLYFAVRGTQVDGHDLIQEAVNKGAIAIVCERLPIQCDNHVTYVVVSDSKKAMGEMASAFYDNPSEQLQVIAITGTNGKTTTISYIAQLLKSLGKKVLLLSTAGDFFDGKEISIARKAVSSLEVIEFHKLLRTFVNQGAEYCCLEATSHGLDQHRLAGIDIDVALFSNITQDHLDYHKTFEHYVQSKALLFSGLKKEAIVIGNKDSNFFDDMFSKTLAKKVSYGKDNDYADYSFSIKKSSLFGTDILLNNDKISVPIIGEFNIYNVILAYITLKEMGYNDKEIQSIISSLKGVPGRLESIPNISNILALVDYAHTPDALENVLKTLKELPHKSIITVIGCGGDRDRTKREPMTRIAQELSDIVFYTSDNPRTEDPEQIFDDMKKGVDTTKENYTFLVDREEAIKQAVSCAQPSDIILVAGKGHEDYQIIGTEKKHFDDREMLRKFLEKKD